MGNCIKKNNNFLDKTAEEETKYKAEEIQHIIEHIVKINKTKVNFFNLAKITKKSFAKQKCEKKFNRSPKAKDRSFANSYNRHNKQEFE
jgi:hypothetical protein